MNQQLPTTPSMCSLLWSHVFTGPDGVIKPCCRFVKGKEIAPNYSSLEQAFGSSEWHRLRELSLKGEKIEGCRRCYEEESSGKSSLRERYNRHPEIGLDACSPHQPSLMWIEFSFSNICNLACRMCDSRYSTKWLAEEKQIFGKPLYNFEKGFIGIDDNVITQNKLKHFKITGGEPFLDKNHQKFLEKIVNKLDVKDIVLDYSTNVTVFPNSAVFNLWKKFKRVELNLSIDSIDEKEVPYIRYPSTSQEIIDNTHRFLKIGEKISSLHYMIRPTVSLFNIYSIGEVFIWWNQLKEKYNFGSRMRESIMHVTFPSYLHPSVLTNRQKEIVRKKLHARVSEYPFIEKDILPMIKVMNLPGSEKLYEKFKSTTTLIDKHRKQDYKSIFDHLTVD